MKNNSRVIWGIVLIIVGVVLGLNSFGITKIDIFFSGWWTLFIIIPCFIGLINDNDKTGSIIGLLVGTLLLLACQDVVDFSDIWKLMLPVALVIIGLSIIFKDSLNGKIRKEIGKINKKGNNDKSYCATFGSQKVNLDNEEFVGCDLDAIFGGVECDLREAIIKKDAVINVSAIFGGVDIFLPDDVNVKVSSTPIFGGVDNKHSNSKKDKTVTIYVNATCVFGGVEVK